MQEFSSQEQYISDRVYQYAKKTALLPSILNFVQAQVGQFLELEEGRLFLWLPVFLSMGIGGYFSLPAEPSLKFVILIFFTFLSVSYIANRLFGWLVVPAILMAIVSGFSFAKMRTELVRGPIIQKAMGFYLVEGEIERLTALPGNHKRILLKGLTISKVKAKNTPIRVRITSRIKEDGLLVGSRIKIRAILRPPPGPVRPNGFDFSRQAWFKTLGAVGFAVSKAQVIQETNKFGLWSASERLRQIVTNKIRAVTSGSGGEVAVALIVGEKQAIDKDVLASIRAAGLAHMLAISGMHMALVSGTMFWVLRAFLAMFETLALSFDVRKIAALGAISIAGGYYLLSGMGISTLRAFIMITIMFVAIILGRKALSLRNVSVAALIILIFLPESLLEVGFQMSFASVVALISFYESGIFKRFKGRSDLMLVRGIDKFVRGASGIFMTTLIAGLAVAPIAVYHFHHITTYSVVGNVLAMPVLTLVVMPMALIGLIAMPFGLHATPLYVMEQGNSLIVGIAHYVAGFDDARINVGTINLDALLLIIAGGLWLCLWKSVYRIGGVFLILIGLAMTPLRPTPFLLIERDGKNVVLIDDNKTMWPVAARVGRYSLKKWQSAFGTFVSNGGKQGAKKGLGSHGMTRDKTQLSGQKRTKWRCDQHGCTTLFQGMVIAYSSHPGGLEEDCGHSDILVATYYVSRTLKVCNRVKKIIDKKDLKRNGSHAIFLKDQELKITNSRSMRGKRPWTQHN